MKFLLCLCILIQGFSVQAMLCKEVRAFQNNPAPRSLETLVERMDKFGIRLEISKIDEMGSPADVFYEIKAYNREGIEVGEISMVQMNKFAIIDGRVLPIYSSHIDVSLHPVHSMVNTGLGTYLYAAAARAIHRLDGVLFSSTAPQGGAMRAWEKMIDGGWAVVGRERDIELAQVNRPRTSLSSYRFNHGLLRDGFFDSLDTRTKDPDAVLVKYFD